ncbi:hypothetical protein Rsub_08260 [Raphidocelis subcapitata]|uniref:Uncharacterized protein n=1 Tax=Raphidocelis subcapitata TaxID=307507 RepID=A0A2V0P7H5_9CHLO|nr:hypothetical protein Rsub_08260 [Raphidocelis subcapitata]|eukprot:GBF95824.1 hypothetical protein Rsub_08260 [Raphidocelis subcapitata]
MRPTARLRCPAGAPPPRRAAAPEAARRRINRRLAALFAAAALAASCRAADAAAAPAPAATLVLYSVNLPAGGGPQDPATAIPLQNLRHFIAAALAPPPPPPPLPGPVDYVFLLPPAAATAAAAAAGAPDPKPNPPPQLLPQLPRLPPHLGVTARYVNLSSAHRSCRHGWAAHGEFLRAAGPGAPWRYGAVVLLDSSMAGPFLPKYAARRMHWLSPFLRKLADGASLVSPTLSCAQTRGGSGGGGEGGGAAAARQVPHPELGAVAFSADALRALLEADDAAVRGGGNGGDGAGDGAPPRGVLGCYTRAADAEHGAAAAAAEVLLARGERLDSLMLRYAGIDWSDPRHWRCNAGISPRGDGMNDGATLDPLEAVFAPRTPALVARRDGAAERAGRLQRWAEAAAGPLEGAIAAAAANDRAAADARALALRRMEAASMGGEPCFDAEHYARLNPDIRLSIGRNATRLYRQYELHGAAEGRAVRWKCEGRRGALLTTPLQRLVRAMAEADPQLPVCEGDLARLWAAAGTMPAVCRAGALRAPEAAPVAH